MRHESVYYTCEGCGNDLPVEGHTVVTAVYTGDRDPTENDDKAWELCAKCWLDVFAVLNRQELKRRSNNVRARLLVDCGGDDELRPWDDI